MDQEAPRHEPFDVSVEQAVLGACIADNATIDVVTDLLDSDSFYDPLHQRIYETICALRSEGAVTPLIVHSVMKADAGLRELGGHRYLADLAAAAPALANLQQVSQILVDLAARRTVIRIAEELVNAAYDPPGEISSTKLAEDAAAALGDVASGTKTGALRKAVSAGDAAHGLLRTIEQQATAARPLIIPTGLSRLDHILGGWLPGKFYVVGGRPGMGKSVLGTNFCRVAAQAGFQADYYSGEMGGEELSARLLCDLDFDRCAADGLKPLVYQDFEHLRASSESMTRAAEAQRALRELPIDIFDSGLLSIEWIDANTRRRMRRSPGRRLIVIDHLQLTHSTSMRRGGNRVEEIAAITGKTKALAKDTGASIVFLSQLGRDVEGRDDKYPRQSDFRDGGSIEQDADGLLGIVRPSRYTAEKIRSARNEEQRSAAIIAADAAKGVLEIGVLKNRSGPEADYFKVFIEEKASAVRDELAIVADMTLQF